MGSPKEKPSNQPPAQKVAELFAEGIHEKAIGIVDGVYWNARAERPVILTLNVSGEERASGSGTSAEQAFKELLLLRAKIAGTLIEYSPEVTILYEAGFVSVPDNGFDRVAKLVEGHEQVQIPIKT